MSSNEISDKLRVFVDRHRPLTEECHAVYLMVELRKVIDQQQLRLPLLKFYADWTVHSSKDRITAEVRQISENLYSVATVRIGAPSAPVAGSASPFEAFENMDGLRSEMGYILAHLGIDPAVLQPDQYWQHFVSLLTEVLANQPIIKPSTNVARIYFEPAKGGCVVEFKHPIGPHTAFQHKGTKGPSGSVPGPSGTKSLGVVRPDDPLPENTVD
jgi:hypothetical protein